MRPRIKLTPEQIENRKKRIESGELKTVTFNKDGQIPQKVEKAFYFLNDFRWILVYGEEEFEGKIYTPQEFLEEHGKELSAQLTEVLKYLLHLMLPTDEHL